MKRRGIRGPTLFALAPQRRRDEPAAIEAQLEAAHLPAFETEWQFCERRWRFDYAWPFFRLALEIEGGAHGRLIVINSGYERRKGRSIPIPPGTRIRVGGRHQTGPGMENDIEKYNRAAILGWLVLRATTRQIRDGEAIRDVRAAFVAKGLE
jgi:very-short-patch-repair endonuclease